MDLKKVVEDHVLWLKYEGGAKADLSGADLRGVDLRGASLGRADLTYTNLSGANLSGANLRQAILYCSDLSGVDLKDANLSGANLHDADLHGADLKGADLSNAYLSGVDLRGADLSGADMSSACLHGAKLDPAAAAMLAIVSGEGDVIGWKKCRDGVIVKLLIPAGARRSNATGRKCRAEYAEVLEGNGVSLCDVDFKYTQGERVTPDNWCEDRWQECAEGIHFFLTRDEAVEYEG